MLRISTYILLLLFYTQQMHCRTTTYTQTHTENQRKSTRRHTFYMKKAVQQQQQQQKRISSCGSNRLSFNIYRQCSQSRSLRTTLYTAMGPFKMCNKLRVSCILYSWSHGRLLVVARFEKKKKTIKIYDFFVTRTLVPKVLNEKRKIILSKGGKT